MNVTFDSVLTRGEIFGFPQWVTGLSAVALVTAILLMLPGGRGTKVLTSLRLTIWTLGISVVLVLLGSLAQVNEGLWNAQARWFKSWIVAGSVVFHTDSGGFRIPWIFPGGHLLGSVLLVNLLAAHWKRFSWSFQKVGIQITHLGIIMLLVGQGLTDELANESMMSFREGETKQYTEHHRHSELVFTTDLPDNKEQVVAVPEALVADEGQFSNPALPFKVKVHKYSVNGDVLERAKVLEAYEQLKGALGIMESKYGSGDLVELAKEAESNERRADVWRAALRNAGDKDFADVVGGAGRIAADPAKLESFRKDLTKRLRSEMLEANIKRGDENGYAAEALRDGRELTEANLPQATPAGIGSRAVAIPQPERKDDKMRNLPFAILELEEGGKSLGQFLVSPILRRQEVEAGGKTWSIGIRTERFYVPFTLKLLKASHEFFQGTQIPRDYRSRVLLENPVTNERREAEIYMNQPLRYSGLTFYQSQMGEDQQNRAVKTSGLQVVENPSWLTPYAGCLVVGLGMLWQFLWHLSKFFSKRIGVPAPEVGQQHPILPLAAAVFVLPDLWVFFQGWRHDNPMTMVAVACTLLLRIVIGWQLARGRYLGFVIVFLSVTTILLVPFAIKYHEMVGSMLWPLVIAQTAVIGAVVSAISNRREPAYV